MVKRSRDQSTEEPRRRICRLMLPPDSFFHSQTFSRNFSRPRSWRDRPSAPMRRSTSIWVAMPAWSVPGCQRVLRPCMRRKRIRASMMALLKPWPMCRLPVTFGGGIMMV